MLMLAGLRPAEGFAVRNEKIDFASGTLLVDGQIGQQGGFKVTKTGDERTVDLSKTLISILRGRGEQKTSSSKVVAITGTPLDAEAMKPGPWLFYPELGEVPSKTDVFRIHKNALRAMRRVLKAAGLPSYFGLHSLRHTFATGLISAGVSPAYVQQQLGHSDMAFTVRVYGSWLPARVPGAVDRLAESLAGSLGHQMDTQAPVARQELA
jgi:integrase